MSVENRIFWLLVGMLALWLVFSQVGRNGVNRFILTVFGFRIPGSGAGDPAPLPGGTSGDGPAPGGPVATA